jgi:hypothetical protein
MIVLCSIGAPPSPEVSLNGVTDLLDQLLFLWQVPEDHDRRLIGSLISAMTANRHMVGTSSEPLPSLES